jgi:hypothetical protein
LYILFLSKLTNEVKCSLIDQYVKKQSGYGTSTFNGSSVLFKNTKRPSNFHEFWSEEVRYNERLKKQKPC